MKAIARGMSASIAACLTILAAGPAGAEQDRSLDSVLHKAGVGAPAKGALSVQGATVDVDGLQVKVLGAEKPKTEGARQTWESAGLRHVGQKTEDGAQLFSILDSKNSPKRVSYDFVGHTLQLQPDGSVVVTEKRSTIVDGTKVNKIVALVEKPWAKDAKGKAVNTQYEVKDGRLTQLVSPSSNASYPIVADPSLTKKWYGWQVRFNRSETGRIAAGFGSCAGFLSLFGRPISYLAASCAAISSWAGAAQAFNRCVALNMYGSSKPTGLHPWYWGC